MTVSHDLESDDPGDGLGDYATVEEVATELARLSASELGKIEIRA